MSASHFLSKSALKTSLWTGAIAGGLVAASLLFSGASSRNLQPMQLDEFGDATPFTIEPAPETDATAKIGLALAGGAVLGLGLNAASKRQGGRLSTVRPATGRVVQPQKTSDFYRASRSLQHKLLLLLHEDQRAAERLVQQATFRYPGKTADWYLEKVIYDLQRDRGVVG